MIYTENDYKETAEMVKLITKIDHINAAYVDEVSDQIYKQQPFFLTVLLGYRKDVAMVELED